MKLLSVILSIVVVNAVITVHVVKPKTDFDHIVDSVNQMQPGWEAEVPSRFGSMEDVKTLCGTWTVGHPSYKPVEMDTFTEVAANIPDSYDARTAHPNCTVISKVRDQSSCGSCWAFGSTEAFEDSRCIATGQDIEFSSMDTAGCCKGLQCGFSNGCNGGQPGAALGWMSRVGVVSGGDYPDMGSKAGGCKPYTLEPCAHHVPPTSTYPKCPTQEYSVSCKKKCSSDSGKSYSSDKTKAGKSFSVDSVQSMQTAILSTGPLAVAFTVYADFPTYKSGVYSHTSGDALGGHAVEMVGWGTEDGQDYWLIKNSWNDQWGDGGFFKIKRGTNECGIEDDVHGVAFSKF